MHRSRTCTMRCRCTGGILCSPPARLRRFGGHPSRAGQFAVVLLPTLLTFEGGLPVHLRAPRYGGQPPPVGDVSSREGWLAGGSSLTNAGERTLVGQTGIEPGCGQITGRGLPISVPMHLRRQSSHRRYSGLIQQRKAAVGWIVHPAVNRGPSRGVPRIGDGMSLNKDSAAGSR